MYEPLSDPDTYQGSTVLKNIPGLRDATALERFEAAVTAERAGEPLPVGRLGVPHYQAIHRHLFQDVYHWAGKFRAVRMAKENSTFCYPEFIPTEMKRIFGWLKAEKFLCGCTPITFAAGTSHFLAELNAIHPFREGNGRTQLAFTALLAFRAGHPLDLGQLDPSRFLAAMIVSFNGDEHALAIVLEDLISRQSAEAD
jgi:cell filamentation protein